jgi:hypothetical protein
MTVDIGNGKTDEIVVHDSDDYIDLATKFVHKHDLPNDVIEPLSRHIRNNTEPVWENSISKPSSPIVKKKPTTPSTFKQSPAPKQIITDNYDDYTRAVRIPTKEEVRKTVPFKKRPNTEHKIASATQFYRNQYFQT